MNNTAKIRVPTDEELKHVRELWLSCGPSALYSAPNIAVELKHYMDDSLRFIGIVAGLHPLTGQPALRTPYPLRISEDGVKRLHQRIRLCSAIMALWTVPE
jgi:hypothetical protein